VDRQALAELRAAHRAARNAREAYWLNAVILLGSGWTPAQVAWALLLDEDTVRGHFKRYKQGGIAALERMNYVGSEALLSPAQLAQLDAHLQEHLHPSAAAVARWVEERFGVCYTDSGMTALLRRLGYRYKKPKLLPGEPPAPEVQEAFVASYQKLKQNRAEHDAVLFMDATHPQHNPVLAGGWIKRGQRFPLTSNTGRPRLNINGVIDVETLHAVIRYDDTIDAESTIALFQQIEAAYPKAATITVFCDNARYYRSKLVGAYLEHSRIDLQFLPAYAPNLNLIERFWKVFKPHVLYSRNVRRLKACLKEIVRGSRTACRVVAFVNDHKLEGCTLRWTPEHLCRFGAD
jgi:transposase